MSYRLDPDAASLAAEVRRIGKDQTEKAIFGSRLDDRHAAVHEVRKRCKKVRALLRCVRPALERGARDTYAAENRAFRDVGRTLADARDAASVVESCHALLGRFEDELDRRVLDPVLVALVSRRDAIVRDQNVLARLDRARTQLLEASARVERWAVEPDGAGDGVTSEDLAKGVRKTYKRARKAGLRAERELGTEALHEWRKRVKYHRHHTRLMSRAWRAQFDTRYDELHALSDALGEDHDLAMLDDVLETSDRVDSDQDVKHVTTFRGLIARRRGELRARAFELGRRLFVESPGRATDRLVSIWNLADRREALEPEAVAPPAVR